MPTPSTRLGLLVPSTSDPFVTLDIANNWLALDANPGVLVCTSTTRPSWGTAQNGQLISETDTGLQWRWNGASWLRVAPVGLLKTTVGGWAYNQVTTDVTTSNRTAYIIIVSVANVVVPSGNRNISITASWNKGDNSVGLIAAGIFRSNVNNQAPQLAMWNIAGDSTSPEAGAQGNGGSYTCLERGGLAAGVYSWSFQFRSTSFGGTSYIHSDTLAVASIAVIEV